MKVTCEIKDYSNPSQPNIKIHNAFGDGKKVELEVEQKRYTVCSEELISAIQRATLYMGGENNG